MTGPSVAFPGEFGAFSDEAIHAFFNGSAISVPHSGFAEVCDTVRNGTTDYGLLPVENSGVGSVVCCYETLADRDLSVVSEIVRPIRHCLVGRKDSALPDIRKVLSHPMALAQCAEFLRQNPMIQAVAASDTASAAKQVAEAEDNTVAAIAGQSTTGRYGLTVLQSDVQDNSDNETRFLLISNTPEEFPRDSQCTETKTIAVFETSNQPGALVAALLPFSTRGINLSKIESRPADGPWAYRFFIEIEAHDPALVSDAVEEARNSTKRFKALGTFSTRISNKAEQSAVPLW